MINNKKFVAVVPARKGSKRLPQKNILDLAGKPLLSWSIEASLKSKYIDKTLVTSDSLAILDIAQKYNIQAVKRPNDLASDTSTTLDVILHALKQVEDEFDYMILLQPTSPLRTQYHIDEAIELLFNKKANAIISVCEMDHSPLWSNVLDETLSMEGFIDENIPKRSQELPLYYRLNGAIYICDIKEMLKEKTYFLKENIYAYKMPKKDSIDIDDEFDFKLASILLKDLS